MDIGLDKAAKTAIDEAAIKLDPMLEAAIKHALDGLKETLQTLLVGRKVTINVE